MTGPSLGEVNIRLTLEAHTAKELKLCAAKTKRCEAELAGLRAHDIWLRDIARVSGINVDDAPPPAISRPVLVIADQDENAA